MGGAISSDAKHFYTDGDVVSEGYTPPTPTRDGYTFTGWSPAFIPTGNKGDIIFTAGWRENELTIRYLSNGADGYCHAGDPTSSSNIQQLNGAKVANKTTPMLYSKPYSDYQNTPQYGIADVSRMRKTGYHPSKPTYWIVKSNGQLVYDNADMTNYSVQDVANFFGVLDEFKKGDVIVDLYTEWEENVLTINYMSNGAEQWNDPNTVDGEGHTITDNIINLDTSKNVIVHTDKIAYTQNVSDMKDKTHTAQYGLLDTGRLTKTGYHVMQLNGHDAWKIQGTNTIVDAEITFERFKGTDVANFLGVLDKFKKDNVTINLYPEWEKDN